MLTRRSLLSFLVIVLVMAAAVIAGCRNLETGEALVPTPSLMLLPSVQPTVQPTISPTVQPTVKATVKPTVKPTIQPTPTLFILGSSYDSSLDLRAAPIEVPLELQIPALNVLAPVLGVGLTSKNVMDAPKGPMGDPVWHKAFWYRGSGIPGDPGTATIAGHVNNLLGDPEIFANLEDLQPGELIILHVLLTGTDIYFIVDQVKVYSNKESSDPAVLTLIFGAGPMAGLGPQPSLDGLSHLTLITCAGNYVNGAFDHHTVVYATRSKKEPLPEVFQWDYLLPPK
jgi:hypothetical protein